MSTILQKFMHSRKKYAHERIFVLICAQLRSVVRSFAPMASNERIFWVAALFHYADRKGVNPRQSKNSNVNFFEFVCQVLSGLVGFCPFRCLCRVWSDSRGFYRVMSGFFLSGDLYYH